MIDIGAVRRSIVGYSQFKALQRINNIIELDESTKGTVNIKFGISCASSISSTIVHTLISQVQFHILNTNTPFLLSLADIDKLSVYFNNLTNALVSPQGDIPTVRRFGYPFLL